MTPVNITRLTILLMMVLMACLLHPRSSDANTSATNINYTQWGDINLGGLFPIHFYDEREQVCSDLREVDSLKRVEAMVYTIRQINKNNTFLPNITLGYEIYDTCSYNAVALRQSLKMIPGQRQASDCAPNSSIEARPPIAGVVGPQRSASAIQSATLFGIYNIPQVSYLATSDELSNDDRYPYFLRTVPPDRFQVDAMVDLLLTNNWKYVSFINSDDTYGKSAQTQFRTRAIEYNICLAVVRTIPATTDFYDELIEDLLKTQSDSAHSTVVILFIQLETATNFFTAADRAGVYRRFIWIGSDGWGNYDMQAVQGMEEVAVGALTVVPLSKQHTSYNIYFERLNPENSSNPWLEEFLEARGVCETTQTPGGNCTKTFNGLDISGHETIVMDSVYAFANALHDMQMTLCSHPNQGMCPEMHLMNGTMLRNSLLNTQFVSPTNGQVDFMPNGDMSGRYSIKNLQVIAGSGPIRYGFVDVAEWVDSDDISNRLMMYDNISWYLNGSSILWDDETNTPQSVCSQPCGVGKRRTVLPENPCCWSCTPCQIDEIVTKNGTSCESCINSDINYYGWPDEITKTSCNELKPTINEAWVTAIVILSSFGLIGTIVTIIMYIHNREKPLIKASSRELSYIIFIGLFLAFLTALLYGLQPTPGVCALRRMGTPISLSLIYVSIATKTIRLYRIFRAGVKSARRPRFISPTSQVMLTLAICVVPVIWIIVFFSLLPPAVIISMPDDNQPRIELACEDSNIEVIGTLTWELLLIIVCCIFAFVTRKLPENYNESRFITFCVFSSLVVFSSFVPAFFTTREAIYKASYSALGLIINGTVTLICLFVVKIYALYFVDERELNIFTQSRTRSNTRINSMVNVQTNEGSIQPSEQIVSGPKDNQGFDHQDGKSGPEIDDNLNHSSNNNKQVSLTPIPANKNSENVGPNSDLEHGLSRSRGSSKNSQGGSGRGISGSLMNRLRGNAARVGDTGGQTIARGDSDAERPGELSTVCSQRNEISRNPTVGQIKSFSQDSTSSQSDDQRLLLRVKKPQKENLP